MKHNTIPQLIFNKIHLWLIILGLLLILVAQNITCTLYKVDLGNALANLGALLLITGALQWLFDSYVKHELFHEISSRTIKNVNVSKSGISDIEISSIDVDYKTAILSSRDITIGINYSPRLLEEYIDEFKERSKMKYTTTILLLDLSSDAAQYIKSIKDESGHLEPNNKKIRSIVNDLNAINDGTVTIKEHKSVLRYSFFRSDNTIWIKPYKNSNGRSKVPAIEVAIDTPLYTYYNNDINNLIGSIS